MWGRAIPDQVEQCREVYLINLAEAKVLSTVLKC